MAVTGKLFGKVFTALWNKEIDYDTDVIKVSLHTSAYTPLQDTDDYFNDALNELGTAGGYTASGVALGSKTVTYTGATNKHTLDADNAQWLTSTIVARTAIVYDSSPATDATRPLICYQQETVDISSSGSTWEVVWAAAGIVEITVG